MRPLEQRYKQIIRYREIVQVLAKHGFGNLIDQLELVPYLSLPRRLFRGAMAGPPLTAPERMRLAIEELGPTFIKFGQIMSTRPDLIPPRYIAQLVKLQDTVPPDPWEAVREQLERELDGSLDELFSSFEAEPVAAASLAQVHQATLPDGEEVVVKVQRPDIEETVEVDLEILFDLAHLVQGRTPLGDIYDLVEIADEFAFTLRNEMDYHREGHNADRFRRNFADETALYLPKVYWDYTTQRVLTLERISGIRLDDVTSMDAAGVDRRQVAKNAARIIIKEVLEDGFFHADPHPGNFFVMDEAVIGAMDFGMVGYLDQRDRENLVRLYIVSVQLDTEGIVEQLIRMGAASRDVDRPGLQRDISRLLNRYHGLPLKEIRAREVIEAVMPVAFRYHLRLPSRLWLLGKTLAMMEGVGLQLDPDFDIFVVSQPYVRKFLWQTVSPQTWGRRLLKSGQDWGELLAGLPRRVPRLVDQLEEGDLQLTLRIREIEALLVRLDRVGNRLAISVLLAAFIVSLALLMPSFLGGRPGWIFWLITLGFVAVSFLGLWLLLSIWRSGRR
jgi:ubiquinone biosynthesis protein